MIKFKHSVKMPSGVVIPAGTALNVSNEGFAFYAGQRVDVRRIPTYALESDTALSGNQLDPDASFKQFDALQPGDMAIDKDGKPARILGKAVGAAGYDALYGQFGNTSADSFEDLTVNMSDDEIAEAKFVAYSNEDGEVLIDIYGADGVSATIATESDNMQVKAFEDIDPADQAVTSDGKPCMILAKGIGETWYKQTAAAFSLDPSGFDEIADKLPEGATGDSVELVLVKLHDDSVAIMPYCPASGACVKEDVVSQASVESIMTAAKRRWEKGGKQAYERMQQAQAAIEQICISESDDDIRTNIQTELTNAGIDFEVDGDDIIVEDNDDNAEALAVIADTYASVKNAMSDAGIECRMHISRQRK